MASSPDRFHLKVVRQVLENGLTVLAYEDHRLPRVAVNLWYHVGSKDEVSGKTGFAHLFEHMMFQGSEHHPEDFFRPLEAIGAQLNGSTAEDRTNYWEVVPSEYVERALWLESDRMGWLLPALDQAKLDNQREVVKNERRQTLENEPYGAGEEPLLEALYPQGHPYRHSIIGSMEDLDGASLEDVHAFFRRYYTPRNASLCLAGDISPEKALAFAERFFGPIPPGPVVSPVQPWVPALARPMRITVDDQVQLPRLTLAWPTVPQHTPEDAALSVLAWLLTWGKDSRLVRRLQVENDLAQGVTGYQASGEVCGAFTLLLTAQPGVALGEVEAATWEELRCLAEEGPEAAEVLAAVAGLKARVVKRLQTVGGFGGIADVLNHYQTFLGDPDRLAWDISRYEAVTPDAVREVARRTLDPERYAAVTVVPRRQGMTTAVDRTAVPGPATAGRFDLGDPARFTLACGASLWVLPRRELPYVTVEVAVRAGGGYDPPDLSGLGDLTADLLDEGAAGSDALGIARRLKSLAASLVTETGREAATFSLGLLSEHFEAGVVLLADVLLRPTLGVSDLERLKKRHLADLARDLDDVAELGGRALRALLFGGESPFGRPVQGVPSTFKTVGIGEVERFYRTHYSPSRTLLTVVGDVEPARAREVFERALAGWANAGVSAALPSAPRYTGGAGVHLVHKPGAPQTYLAQGIPGLARNDAEYPGFLIFNEALGGQFTSRINMNLREEKGYTYGVRSYLAPQRGIQPWVVVTAVQADRTAESLSEVRREIAEILGQRPLAPEEFEAARSNWVLRFPQSFETQQQVCDAFVGLWVLDLPVDFHTATLKKVRGLTLEDARVAGTKVFGGPAPVVVAVGDKDLLAPAFSAAGFGEAHLIVAPGQE